MKVENVGERIKVEASYEDMATIIQALDQYATTNKDEYVRELAYQLHNPSVVVSK